FDERFLRDVHAAHRLHALLALFLLLEQLAFAGDVAAITLRGHVLAKRADRFASDDLAADGGLDGHLVLLARDDLLEFGGQRPSPALRLVAMDDAREG